VRIISEIRERCVNELQVQGKSKSLANAICAASLKKFGDLDSLEGALLRVKNKLSDHEEFETYLQKNSLVASKKQSKEPTFNRFSSRISQESFKFSDNGDINIQCLREGKFKHPWYGTLKFDRKFFAGMIRNFEADIPNPEIAFDFKHDSESGAAAWITKLFVEGKNLMASVSLTPKGRKAIEEKEFKYFSIEYTDDYVEYQYEEAFDKQGKVTEIEQKISHGPTTLGGGLTNRPFIKGMAPVSLSEDGDFIEFEELTKETQTNKEVENSMDENTKSLEELKAEQEKLKAEVKALAEDKEKNKNSSKEEGDNKPSDKKKKKDDSDEKLEELQTQLEDVTAKIEAGQLEKMDDIEKIQKQLSEKDGENKKLSDDIKALSETVKSLMNSNKLLHDDKYKLSVEKRLEEFRKLGAFPATLKTIEEICFSDAAKGFEVKLSEGEGDNKKEVTKSFLDVIESVLDSIPKENRFSDNELSESITTPTGNSKELSLEDVEKIAKEKGLSFEETLIELSKEGKIE